MMSDAEEELARPVRKRASRSNNDGDGVGARKSRGRPRVNKPELDATAADRRRTQIRLAQRAYRQRKETTISSLQRQSLQLHSIIEQMNTSYTNLNEKVSRSGLLQLNPALATEFKTVTETFEGLVKRAGEGFEDSDDVGEGVEEAGGMGRQKESAARIEPRDVELGYEMVDGEMAEEPSQVNLPQPDNYFSHLAGTYGQQASNNDTRLVRRRQFTVGEILDQSRYPEAPPPPQPSSLSSSQLELPFGLIDTGQQRQQGAFPPSNTYAFSVDIPTPDVTPPSSRFSTPMLQLPKMGTKTLPCVDSYSFQETTFARRLFRTTLEAAIGRLSGAFPAMVNRKFKLSLPYQTPEQIRNRFIAIASRASDEDLDWWEAPFIHLGGAGTHYPRRDAAGNAIPIRNGWTIRQIGPREKKMSTLESTEDGRSVQLNGVDIDGLEGEWFDAYDVQGYLEERYACRPDPTATFAQLWIDVDAEEEDSGFPPLTHSTSISSSSFSSTESTTRPPFSALDLSYNHMPAHNYSSDFSKSLHYDAPFNQTLDLGLAPGFGLAYGVDLGLGMMGGNVGSLPMGVRERKKKSVWVDVCRLVEELIKPCICLGRAPGYRRDDVDRAVRKAMVQTHQMY